MFLKNLLTLVSLFLSVSLLNAQNKYFTKTGTIVFYSKSPLEDIEAKNKTVTAVLDAKTGAFQFSVQMKGFEFEKALMQEHFNENYVESEKFPKAEFKGTIVNNQAINYKVNGVYTASIKGKLTIHGVTKEVLVPGTIKVDGTNITGQSTFTIKLSDYKITIPSIAKDKLSNNIKIVVDVKLEPFSS